MAHLACNFFVGLSRIALLKWLLGLFRILLAWHIFSKQGGWGAPFGNTITANARRGMGRGIIFPMG